jgi:hypothetical protein
LTEVNTRSTEADRAPGAVGVKWSPWANVIASAIDAHVDADIDALLMSQAELDRARDQPAADRIGVRLIGRCQTAADERGRYRFVWELLNAKENQIAFYTDVDGGDTHSDAIGKHRDVLRGCLQCVSLVVLLDRRPCRDDGDGDLEVRPRGSSKTAFFTLRRHATERHHAAPSSVSRWTTAKRTMTPAEPTATLGSPLQPLSGRKALNLQYFFSVQCTSCDGTEKALNFSPVRLAFFSNRCLNSLRPFETGLRAMAKTKRVLSVGLIAVSLTGSVMASQWGYAAEPPAYPVPATPEMMQLVRDEHDLVAEMIKVQFAAERDRYAEPRTAISATPATIGAAYVPRTRGRRNS